MCMLACTYHVHSTDFGGGDERCAELLFAMLLHIWRVFGHENKRKRRMGKALNTRLDGSEVTLKKASCLGVFVKIIPTPTSSRTLVSTSHSPPFLTCVDF